MRSLPIQWELDPDLTRRLAWSIGIAMVGTGAVLAALALRARFLICLIIAAPATLLISASHAHIRDGRGSFIKPFDVPRIEYFDDIPAVGDDPLRFIANYPQISPTLSHHAGTHPPGGVLFLWVGAKWFGTSIDAASWWSAIFSTLGLLPACAIARTVGGMKAARRLLPLYIAAPTIVLFTATCLDAVFMVFGLVALALGLAANRRGTIWQIAAAGAALWLSTFLNFATIAIPVLLGLDALVGFRRGWRTGFGRLVRTAMVGVGFVACSFLAWQFLSYDLLATVNVAAERDHSSFGLTGFDNMQVWYQISIANILGVMLGSGVVLTAMFVMCIGSGLSGRQPIHRFGWTVLLTLVLLCASTLFTLETERVLILFTPLLAICATTHFKGKTIWLLAPLGLLGQAFLLELYYNTRW